MRPFDFLNNSLNKPVIVGLKGGKEFRGVLLAFDVHMNVVLEKAEMLSEGEPVKGYGKIFLRGDSILYISPSEG